MLRTLLRGTVLLGVSAIVILLGACEEGPGATPDRSKTQETTRDPQRLATGTPVNWTGVYWNDVLALGPVADATYIIGYQYDQTWPPPASPEEPPPRRFEQVGTGFAAYYENTLWTNAHVAEELKEALQAKADLNPIAVAVRSGTTVGGSGTYRLQTPYQIHPEYDGTTNSPDIALIPIGTRLPVVMPLLPRAHVVRLQVGQPVATVGFPGELEQEYMEAPIATFKDGTIIALKPYSPIAPTLDNTRIVQHNLNTSGGTSGSPVFDRYGYVVAVNHAGIEVRVLDYSTLTFQRVGQGLIEYAIRVDEVWAMVDLFEARKRSDLWVAALTRKPVADYQPFP